MKFEYFIQDSFFLLLFHSLRNTQKKRYTFGFNLIFTIFFKWKTLYIMHLVLRCIFIYEKQTLSKSLASRRLFARFRYRFRKRYPQHSHHHHNWPLWCLFWTNNNNNKTKRLQNFFLNYIFIFFCQFYIISFVHFCSMMKIFSYFFFVIFSFL